MSPTTIIITLIVIVIIIIILGKFTNILDSVMPTQLLSLIKSMPEPVENFVELVNKTPQNAYNESIEYIINLVTKYMNQNMYFYNPDLLYTSYAATWTGDPVTSIEPLKTAIRESVKDNTVLSGQIEIYVIPYVDQFIMYENDRKELVPNAIEGTYSGGTIAKYYSGNKLGSKMALSKENKIMEQIQKNQSLLVGKSGISPTQLLARMPKEQLPSYNRRLTDIDIRGYSKPMMEQLSRVGTLKDPNSLVESGTYTVKDVLVSGRGVGDTSDYDNLCQSYLDKTKDTEESTMKKITSRYYDTGKPYERLKSESLDLQFKRSIGK